MAARTQPRRPTRPASIRPARRSFAPVPRAGGIPVLAHPHVTGKDEYIPELVGYGLGGIEAYQEEHHKAMEAKAKEQGKTLPAPRNNACDRMKARGVIK